MRNLKSIIAIFAISIATTFSTSAIDKGPKKVTQKLRTEIASMLGNTVKLDINSSSRKSLNMNLYLID